MRRLALSTVLLAVLAVPAGAAGKPLKVSLTACHHSVNAVDRYLRTVSTVRLVPHSTRVVLRYELFWRQGGEGAFARYPAPAFERPFGKASQHVYTVGNLPAGAAYRLRVGARWTNKRGRVVHREQRVTETCREPDLRPNLKVVRFERLGGGRFAAVIRNTGATAAGPFSAAGIQFAGLRPGGAVRVTVRRCTTVTVDPDDRVAERNEDDNTASSPCPAG